MLVLFLMVLIVVVMSMVVLLGFVSVLLLLMLPVLAMMFLWTVRRHISMSLKQLPTKLQQSMQQKQGKIRMVNKTNERNRKQYVSK